MGTLTRAALARRGGRADLYAGFCCRRPLPVWRWRPSILARRCRRAHATYPQARASSPRAPAVRSCSERGLPSRRSRLRRWWALTPPFHPYRPVTRQAVCSLWHCPAGHPGWLLATALLCGARTFLDPRVAPRHRGRPVGSSAGRTLSPPRPARPPTGPALQRAGHSSMRTRMTSLASAWMTASCGRADRAAAVPRGHPRIEERPGSTEQGGG